MLPNLFHAMGAHVTVLDIDLRKLQAIGERCIDIQTVVAYD